MGYSCDISQEEKDARVLLTALYQIIDRFPGTKDKIIEALTDSCRESVKKISEGWNIYHLSKLKIHSETIRTLATYTNCPPTQEANELWYMGEHYPNKDWDKVPNIRLYQIRFFKPEILENN